MKLKKLTTLLWLIFPLLFISCSDIGFMGKGVEQEIESFGDFFSVYFRLQLSILFVGVFISFLLGGQLGAIISVIIHFIWVVSYRDYGFFMVLLLFSFLTIINIALSFLWAIWKSKK